MVMASRCWVGGIPSGSTKSHVPPTSLTVGPTCSQHKEHHVEPGARTKPRVPQVYPEACPLGMQPQGCAFA